MKYIPFVVCRGVDTLVVNGYYTDESGHQIKRDLPEAMELQLEEWKRAAQAAGDEYATSWVFDGACLRMCPNGAGRGQFPWMLKSSDITLYISSGQWNGITSVRFNSEYLWSCQGVRDAVNRVQSFLDALFEESIHLQPSAIDLCADIAGWEDIERLDRSQSFVSRSVKGTKHAESDWSYDHKLREHTYGLKKTGFDFSSRGAVSCTIYDKTREVKRSGKLWFVDWWVSSGWNEATGGKVWRVEFKFKREALHELLQEDEQGDVVFHGIEDVYELLDRLEVLWTYATGHVDGGTDGLADGWLRCVVPTEDSNRARWPTHPVWKVVQAAWSNPMEAPKHFGKLVRKRKEERNVEKALEAVMGYSTTICAWVGGPLSDPDIDFSVFLHWLAREGEKYLKRTKRDFGAEVQHKRKKFSLPRDNNKSEEMEDTDDE